MSTKRIPSVRVCDLCGAEQEEDSAAGPPRGWSLIGTKGEGYSCLDICPKHTITVSHAGDTVMIRKESDHAQ